MTEIAHLLTVGWTALSLGATIAGLGGIGLILVALFAAAYLPSFLRTPLIGAGIVLLVGGALFQAGQAKGTHDAFAVAAAKELKAEKARADAESRRQAAAAAKIGAADRARADKAEAVAKASRERLADLKRNLARTPDRACASADDARRLRDL
ncbi:hypothetical protein ACRAWG_32635 [Methylobacterium sp. P31]